MRSSFPSQAITIDLTGPDWEPTPLTRWYAQRGETFAFGPAPGEALQALLTITALNERPASQAPADDPSFSADTWARSMNRAALMRLVASARFEAMDENDWAAFNGAEPDTVIARLQGWDPTRSGSGDQGLPVDICLLMTPDGSIEAHAVDWDGEHAAVGLNDEDGFQRLI